MGSRIDELISIAGSAIGMKPAGNVDASRAIGDELSTLLGGLNGLYALESALHVFPAEPVPAGVISIQHWNSPDLWRDSYGDLTEGLFFFAEDVFGAQFAVCADRIVIFEPETGAVEELAVNLEEWADKVLSNHGALTGYPIAHAWQTKHGRLPPGKRLLPKRPFVLRGDYSVGNLYALGSVEGMRLRGELALQIKNLPEGAKVRFTVIE